MFIKEWKTSKKKENVFLEEKWKGNLELAKMGLQLGAGES